MVVSFQASFLKVCQIGLLAASPVAFRVASLTVVLLVPLALLWLPFWLPRWLPLGLPRLLLLLSSGSRF